MTADETLPPVGATMVIDGVPWELGPNGYWALPDDLEGRRQVDESHGEWLAREHDVAVTLAWRQARKIEALEADLSQCVKQEVWVSPDGRTAVFVERRGQRDGSFLWAVVDSFGGVLDKAGCWWVEPPASDRTDEYLASTRWPNRADAVTAARAAKERA